MLNLCFLDVEKHKLEILLRIQNTLSTIYNSNDFLKAIEPFLN